MVWSAVEGGVLASAAAFTATILGTSRFNSIDRLLSVLPMPSPAASCRQFWATDGADEILEIRSSSPERKLTVPRVPSTLRWRRLSDRPSPSQPSLDYSPDSETIPFAVCSWKQPMLFRRPHFVAGNQETTFDFY